jgi:hypothetical protein
MKSFIGEIARRKKIIHRCVLAGLVILAFAGCARFQTKMMKTELQEVAKRWCLTIRASQVVPVYPLTEDIQPGDIFLVQTPIPGQVSQYTHHGYLPLDIQLHRLMPLDYKSFYADGYLKGDYADTPHARPTPASPLPGAPPTPHHRFDLARLPAAAFPDYGFEAKKGVGLQLAVPISGVPVGMSFMGASSVNGSVKLSEAFTYGLDDASLLAELYAWAKQPDVQLLLAKTRKSTRAPIYLRIVSRVYLVGGVDVALQAQGATSGGADVGVAKPINPMSLTKDQADELKSVADAYKEAAAKFTEALNQSLPGGSVRFSTANRNSVTMHEEFGRLLAIGYLGFDVQVDAHGNLGAPVATLDVLEAHEGAEKRLLQSVTPASRQVIEGEIRELYRRVISDTANTSPAIDSIRRQLDAFGDSIVIPTGLPFYVQSSATNPPTQQGEILPKVGTTKGFNRFSKYRSALNNSLEGIGDPGANATLKADQKLLQRASEGLTREFETSDHVALALKIYCDEVLTRR